jgi:hypothetical protein
MQMEVMDIIIWEGIWGMLITSVCLILTSYFKGISFLPKDDLIFATYQVINSWEIQIALLSVILIMGPFNYYGASKISNGRLNTNIVLLRTMYD